ncbi:MAG: AAA family ATPase, partial [Proteobacteria bacterium]|nr:AAA family ATPase [Pseudomonadota bacterium]
MARAELLISLVKAGMRVDRNAVRAAAETIIADEKSKQHNILADRIARALQTTKAIDGSRPSAQFLHQPNDKGRQALAEVTAKHRLDDLALNPQTRSNSDSLVEEQRQATHLKSNGLEPRHRIMLIGPPGNGKTTLAEAIAQALAVPFFVIRYDCLIGSYLGETAQRLKQTLDYVKAAPCVLFFDEFDTIGKERGDTNETGEIKRVVSSLLMQVDDLPSHTIIIAASNHPELLDRATWRRFQLRLP